MHKNVIIYDQELARSKVVGSIMNYSMKSFIVHCFKLADLFLVASFLAFEEASLLGE